MELKRVGVLSVGKVLGTLGVLVGLLVGVFVMLASMLGASVQQMEGGDGPQMPAVFLGVGGLIFFPLVYGIGSFISGIIYAFLYNLVAGIVGGIELDLQSRQP